MDNMSFICFFYLKKKARYMDIVLQATCIAIFLNGLGVLGHLSPWSIMLFFFLIKINNLKHIKNNIL
jgi:hypothetical protein